jgi:hypothetical protein
MLVYVHTAGGPSAVPNIDPMARAALEILETNYLTFLPSRRRPRQEIAASIRPKTYVSP